MKEAYRIQLTDLELEGLTDDVWEVERKLPNGDKIIICRKSD